MKHSGHLGGLEYLAASYARHDFPKHVHDEYLIGVIDRGVHDVRCRGELWHAGPGTVATFAPGEPHSGGAGADAGWSQKIFYLPETMIEQVLEDGDTPSFGTWDFKAPFQSDGVVARDLWRLWRLLENDHSSALAVEEHLVQFIPRLAARASRTQIARPREIPARLGRARDYIHEHFAEAVQLDQLASIAGCSKASLIEGFKAHFGVPPNRYLIQVRIGQARLLLRQGREIAEVAVAVGFADQSHMTRFFKAILGVTPARYRTA